MNIKENILAIDNGTQSLRAMIVNPHGELLAISNVAFDKAYLSPQDGWAEQDAMIYWDALVNACQGLWNSDMVKVSSIAGITITTQRSTVVNVDRDGKPLRPAIVWLDKRKLDIPKPVRGMMWWLIKLMGQADLVRRLVSNAESRWIQAFEPEVWEKTHRYLLLSGFLNYKLTGQYIDSAASQVAYIPFDYRKQTWLKLSDWRWESLRIKREMLPDLTRPGEQIGRVTPEASRLTGIPEGLPVLGSASDKACEVLGSGGLSPDVACLSYGSTATVNIMIDRYMELHSFIPPYPSGIPGRYNLEFEVYRGYWLVEWFRREIAQSDELMASKKGISIWKVLEGYLEETNPGADGLISQPYWTPGVKWPGSEARGCFIGLTDRHGRAHLYRALVEGIAFSLRHGKEMIEKRSAVPIKRIVISGGGCCSDGIMRLSADIFGLSVERSHSEESSGLGAAMIAMVGLGIHRDFESAMTSMCRPAKTFEPNLENVSLYEDIYKQVYSEVYNKLSPLYRRLNRLFHGDSIE